MGVGRRMKKQGPPQSLEELGLAPKRKSAGSTKEDGRAVKRRKGEDGRLRKEDKRPIKDLSASESSKGLKAQPKNLQPAIHEVVEEALGKDDAEEDLDLDPLLAEDADADEEMSEMEAEELNEADLEEADFADDSVFDSDAEDQPVGMFSEDEDSDAEEKLTAANIEGLSRKLDQQQAELDAQAQAELEEDGLQTNIADGEAIDTTATNGLAPDLQVLRIRITDTIRILSNFAKHNPDQTKSRADYIALFHSDVATYYGYTPFLATKLASLFTPSEAFAFFEANESPRPTVLRTNTLRTNRRQLAQALINRGVVLEPVGKWSKVGLQVFEAPVPLGATPEYLAGHYILQAASSFLPVMALAPQPNERILDMAAAPGGKTTYISALMRNTGAVFANDANRQRAKGLIGNVHRLGVKNCVVTNLDARTHFPKTLGGFDRVLLDAPCTGTGVIGKDASVKTSKTERDFMAVPHLQRQLLLAAIDSVDHASKTGGYVVYSTCSVTVEENEMVVQYVLRKRPNVRLVETGLGTFGSEGFRSFEGKVFDEKMGWTRRYFPHRENVDGFFVAKLRKTGPSRDASGRADVQGSGVVNGSSVKTTTNGKQVDHHDTEMEASDDHPVRPSTGTKEPKEDDGDGNGDGDDFGGFDSDEDQSYLEKAEKKWLKQKGLDPRLAAAKKDGKLGDKSRSKSSSSRRVKVNDDGKKSKK